MMTEDALTIAIKDRISDPQLRIEMKTIGTPPIFGPASAAAINAAEAATGLRMPPLLKRLYHEVANGGFGPGAGFLGVESGYTNDGHTLTSFNVERQQEGWPGGILILCDMGCGEWICADGHGSDQVLITHALGITRPHFTLSTLLERWVNGADMSAELFEEHEYTVTDPITRKAYTLRGRGPAKGALIKSFPR